MNCGEDDSPQPYPYPKPEKAEGEKASENPCEYVASVFRRNS